MNENRMLEAVKKPKSKLRGILYTILAIVLVQIFLSIGFFLGTEVSYILAFIIPADWIQAMMFTIDPIFMSLIQFLFPAALVCLWVRFVEKRPIVSLGFFKKKAWLELLKGWLLGSLLIALVVALMCVTGSIQLSQLAFSSANILSLVLIIPFWLVQSGTEELLTRGWLFPVAAKNCNLWIGIAISSGLFAVLHLFNPSVTWISLLNIALFGLLGCLYVLKTDNIWGIAALHAAWNCVQGSFFGLSVSGLSTTYATMRFENSMVPDYLSGGGFGPEGSLHASLILGAFSLWLAWDLYRRKKRNTADNS